MNLGEIVKKFKTTPVLFIGSGITRRYYNLPNWNDLLKYFSEKIKDDEFIFNSYINMAKSLEQKAGLLPKVAELIQKDFDKKWFENKNIRTLNKEYLIKVKNGISPFKAEIAMYIKNKSVIQENYLKEIEMLKEISRKNISGVITTNYDMFLENNLDGYRKFIGQEELIFSSIQGLAEIYKIHGSIENPETIVINEEDYIKFEKQSSYLAAKLMTIFMEYPIIFMGYSISDTNILKILEAIVECMPSAKLEQLRDRFIFVEYKEDEEDLQISSHTILINGKSIFMTKVTTSDFSKIYSALKNKKSKIPARILRTFKEELYNYTLTNTPTANLRVASINDNRIDGEELVMAIGKVSDLGLKGLKGLESNEWYKNILLDNLEFSADELLEYAYPKLAKMNSFNIPLNKYLKQAEKRYEEYEKRAKENNFEKIISKSLKNSRKYITYSSVKEIWDKEKLNIERATRYIAGLTEKQINLSELEIVLRELFKNENILEERSPNVRTNIRRLISIYDYLKWGK